MIGFGFFLHDAPGAIDLIERADAAGVDTAWMVMPPLGYDTPTLAAAALARTERIRVGTSIVPAFTRHPLALATQAVALDGLGPGRFRLGIGVGNMVVMADGFGTPVTAPIAQTREYLAVVRSALATGTARVSGEHYTVDATLPAPVATGVTLAAIGPRMYALAGEAADAAMSWMSPVAYLDEVARPAMAKGAAEAGRPVPPLVTHVLAIVSSDPDAARAAARPAVRTFGANANYAGMYAAAGLPVAPDGTPTDELVDAITVVGDEATLTDRLAALAATRDELVVSLEPIDDRRAEEDTVLRAIANASR
jgi:5,10-methylenetetrahydromethanopterin reductase